MTRDLVIRQMLPSLKHDQVIARTPPASKRDLVQLEAFVFGGFKIPGRDVIANPSLQVSMLCQVLKDRGYSADVIAVAFQTLIGTEEWLPAIAKWVKTCDAIVKKSQRREREQQERRQYEAECRKIEEQRTKRKADDLDRLRTAFGKHLDIEQIEKAYAAMESVFSGTEMSIWMQAAEEKKSWAVQAAKFMSTVEIDCLDSGGGIESERERAWGGYMAIRHACKK